MTIPIKLDFQFDDDVIVALQDAIAAAPRTMNKWLQRSLPHNMVTELQREPARPRYPLKWRSDKQRKFVMAKLRKAGNLPYRRTGKLRKGWKLKTIITNTVIGFELANETPYAPFVVGALPVTPDSVRQPMFPQWPDAEAVWLKHVVTFEDQAIEVWLMITEVRPGTFA